MVFAALLVHLIGFVVAALQADQALETHVDRLLAAANKLAPGEEHLSHDHEIPLCRCR